MRVFTVAQMQDAERRTETEFGVSLWTLMQRAGRGLAQTARDMLGESPGTVWVFCGSGNNGGDGYVCASVLRGWDLPVAVFAGPHAPADGGLAAMARDEWLASGGEGTEVAPPDKPALIVDAIFGTGLGRPVTGVYAEMIDVINRLDVPVLACDVPSGVAGDTGEIMGVAVRATKTLMMGLAKPACQLPPGSEYFGELEVCDILPAQLVAGLLGSVLPAHYSSGRRRSHRRSIGDR